MFEKYLMTTKPILAVIAFTLYLSGFGFSQPSTVSQNYVSLTPDLTKVTLKNGYGTIPFTIKNNYTDDVALWRNWSLVVYLMRCN